MAPAPQPKVGEYAIGMGRPRIKALREKAGTGDNKTCPCGKFEGKDLKELVEHLREEHEICPFPDCKYSFEHYKQRKRMNVAQHLNKHASDAIHLDNDAVHILMRGRKKAPAGVRIRTPEQRARLKEVQIARMATSTWVQERDRTLGREEGLHKRSLNVLLGRSRPGAWKLNLPEETEDPIKDEEKENEEPL